MNRRLILMMATTLALLFFAFCALLWWMASALTVPRHQVVQLADDLKVVQLSFRAADSTKLAGSYLAPSKANTGCVLLLHGNGGSRAQFVQQLRILQGAGFGALAIDFRGHGESGGTMTTAGGYEKLDADAAFDVLKQRCPNRKIGIYGFSLGGASALLGSAASRADAIILDAVYQDIHKAIFVRLNNALGSIGARIVTWPLLRMLELKTGLRMDDMDNAKAAARIRAPALLLIGGADWAAPENQMKAIGSALKSTDISYIVVPHALHGANAAMLGKAYPPLLLGFFERTLTEK